MVAVTQSIAIKAPMERVWDVLADFESYPEFQPEVEKIAVTRRTKNTAVVSFTINLIAKVHYALKFEFDRPNGMTWTTVEGHSLVRSNTGSWKLTRLEPHLTDLTCTMDVEFGIWIPKAIADGLMHNHFPAMLDRFKDRAEGPWKPPARRKGRGRAHPSK